MEKWVQANTFFPYTKRLHFLALHLDDLQSLKWLGFQLALTLVPTTHLFPVPTNCWIFATLLLCAAAWLFFFRAYCRRRFGRTTLSAAERIRQRYPSKLVFPVVLIFTAGHFISRYYYRIHSDDWLLSSVIVVCFLSRILDETNLIERRAAYAIGLAICIVLFLWLVLIFTSNESSWMQELPISAFGSLLALLSLLDFYLLTKAAAQRHA